jgi:hypothetical protein
LNDELSGQLAVKGWRIPQYAQNSLYLETESATVKAEGQSGLFTLPAPASQITVRWGHEEGAALASLPWRVDSLEWDGEVNIGGYVDAVHLMTIDEAEGEFAAVICLGGQPVHRGAALYPAAASRTKSAYTHPDFYAMIDDSVLETNTTWLAAEDSPLLTLAQDAMLNKLRVIFSGRLSPDGAGWDKLLALPLRLESVTLFTP